MTADYETPPLPFAGEPDRTCPWCGKEEPNELLLANNHGPDLGRALAEQECTAMDLTRRHVDHDVQAVLDARADVATHRLHGQPTQRAENQLQHAQARLNRSVARAREVWPDPSWVARALALLG